MSRPVLKLDQVRTANSIFRLPRIVAFNRLEARPRTRDFTRSLRAEIRDPLWMLTRQWQFGEFKGEDAASCVTSRIAFEHESMDRVAFAKQNPFEYDEVPTPLETLVEKETIPLAREKGIRILSDVVFAVQWGKQFSRLLTAAGLQTHYKTYVEKYQIDVLESPSGTVNDPEADQIRRSVAKRIADGVKIILAVESGDHDTWVETFAGGDSGQLKTIAASFADSCSKKFQRLFVQPKDETESAWLKNHLEYQFSVGGHPLPRNQQTVLFAEQYHQGRLDWHSFDSVRDRQLILDEPSEPVAKTEELESFLPANVRFKGQPRPRFWEMEETQTDFGKIETSTTGLLHLLLAEFGLIYSNDWFMLPHPMPINTVCEIRGILVDDTFGRHTFIRPAGRGPESDWQRWSMFALTERGSTKPEANRFYLVPTVGKVLESDPLERVNFMRDEMANIVWAVENIVPSQTGKGVSGYETSPANVAPTLTTTDEDIRIKYRLGTFVPKNWIPFIAVHAEGSVSEIRLQRARMVAGESPRGWILREPKSPYFVEEEEVPRTGVYVERSWQRARWLRGRTMIWIGRRKTAGRGEGWSQLVFDQILDLQVQRE